MDRDFFIRCLQRIETSSADELRVILARVDELATAHRRTAIGKDAARLAKEIRGELAARDCAEKLAPFIREAK